MSYDFIPRAKGGTPIHEDVTYELEQYPEDKTEKDLERTSRRRSAAHEGLPRAASSRARPPVADIEQLGR